MRYALAIGLFCFAVEAHAQSADLTITVTDGVVNATPGGSVTYTITATNTGPDPALAVTVADTFPAALTCDWTCMATAGATVRRRAT